MGRIALIAAALYGWGAPALDGHRPQALDRLLREFHRTVDVAVIDAWRALATLDDARSMRYLTPLLRRLDTAL